MLQLVLLLVNNDKEDFVLPVLMSLMIDTQSTFDQILKMQMPDIIPFENIELENEFKSLSNKLSID